MAEAEIEQHPPTVCNDRFFGAIPVAPLWVGAAIAIGLLALSLLLGDRRFNPISPPGFLAATAGAFLLLILCRGLYRCFSGGEQDHGGQ